jgi:ABC-type nickel/cobalt efflux system permease component RcnA
MTVGDTDERRRRRTRWYAAAAAAVLISLLAAWMAWRIVRQTVGSEEHRSLETIQQTR